MRREADIAAAITAERERCARVVEEFVVAGAGAKMCRLIAKKIREGT